MQMNMQPQHARNLANKQLGKQTGKQRSSKQTSKQASKRAIKLETEATEAKLGMHISRRKNKDPRGFASKT